MEYETLTIDLPEELQLELICSVFDIDEALLKNIQKQNLDHNETVVSLVLSECVARALARKLEEDWQSGNAADC